MMALVSGDVDALAALLSDEVRVIQDSAGDFLAARNIVRGARDVARLFIGLARKGPMPIRLQEVWVNGELAQLVHATPMLPRHAPRFLMRLEVDAHGRIRQIFNILATQKLGRMFPDAFL
jgi:hypothetical protein